MSTSSDDPSQNHPLYAIDRDHIDRLLSRDQPQDADLVELARLLIRYDGFPGADDLREDMERLLSLWSLSRDALNNKTRALWSAGFRPGMAEADAVGSGFDTSENSSG